MNSQKLARDMSTGCCNEYKWLAAKEVLRRAQHLLYCVRKLIQTLLKGMLPDKTGRISVYKLLNVAGVIASWLVRINYQESFLL